MLTRQFISGLTANGYAGGGSPGGVLHRVAELAAHSVRGCAGVALYVRRDPEEHAAVTHPYVAALLDLQNSREGGPAPQALSQRAMVRLADTMDDRRWPRFCATAVTHGVRSVLALPVVVTGRGQDAGENVVAVCTLYGARPHVFDQPEASTVATLLAEQATVVLSNEEIVTQARESATHSQRKLATRTEIEQAKGMLMQALDCGPDEAFHELRQASQNSNRKLQEVAHWLITERQGLSHT